MTLWLLLGQTHKQIHPFPTTHSRDFLKPTESSCRKRFHGEIPSTRLRVRSQDRKTPEVPTPQRSRPLLMLDLFTLLLNPWSEEWENRQEWFGSSQSSESSPIKKGAFLPPPTHDNSVLSKGQVFLGSSWFLSRPNQDKSSEQYKSKNRRRRRTQDYATNSKTVETHLGTNENMPIQRLFASYRQLIRSWNTGLPDHAL